MMALLEWLFPTTPGPAMTHEQVIRSITPPPPKRQIQVIKYTDQMYDVGVSTVSVVFSDGREVYTKVYGEVSQYVRHSDRDIFFSKKEKTRAPVADAAYIDSSVSKFKSMLMSYDHSVPLKFVDDEKNPTVAWSGMVAHMELVETQPHEVGFRTATLEWQDVE